MKPKIHRHLSTYSHKPSCFPYVMRATSLALSLVLFVHNSVLVHAGENNFWKDRSTQHKGISGDNQLAQLPQIENPIPWTNTLTYRRLSAGVSPSEHSTVTNLISLIPQNLGMVRHISSPARITRNRTVIHIQDVHQNLEAQTNISGTIQKLIETEKIDLLALEGTNETIDLSTLKSFSNQAAVKEASNYYFSQKLLDGPLYSALQVKGKLPLIQGVDDKEHHRANIEAYRSSLSSAKQVKQALQRESFKLSAQKKSIFNQDLLAFDNQVQQYHEGKLSLGEHVAELAKHDLQVADNTAQFLNAYRLEKALNFAQVEKDRAAIIQRLSSQLKKEKLAELYQAAMLFQTGGIGQADFYTLFQATCLGQNIPLSHYPQLSKYISYVLLAEKINAEQLSSDINRMEVAGYLELATNGAEKNLIIVSRKLDLTQKLIDFSLTRDEWKEYKTNKQQPSTTVRRFTPSFENFYREAELRDIAMAKNLLALMEKKNFTNAVLVTGGFHSEGIDRALKEAGVTSITFVPRLTQIDSTEGTSYLSIFAQKTAPLDEILSGQKLFLQRDPTNALGAIKLATAAVAFFLMDRANFGTLVKQLEPGAEGIYTAVKTTNEVAVTMASPDRTSSMQLVLDHVGHILNIRIDQTLFANSLYYRVGAALLVVLFFTTLALITIAAVNAIMRRRARNASIMSSPIAIEPPTVFPSEPVITSDGYDFQSFAIGISDSYVVPRRELEIQKFLDGFPMTILEYIQSKEAREAGAIANLLTSPEFKLNLRQIIAGMNESTLSKIRFKWTYSDGEFQIIFQGLDAMVTPISASPSKDISNGDWSEWKVFTMKTETSQSYFLAKRVAPLLDPAEIKSGAELKQRLGRLSESDRVRVLDMQISNLRNRPEMLSPKFENFTFACLHIGHKDLFDAAIRLIRSSPKKSHRDRLARELIAINSNESEDNQAAAKLAEFYLNHFPPNDQARQYAAQKLKASYFPIERLLNTPFGDDKGSRNLFRLSDVTSDGIILDILLIPKTGLMQAVFGKYDFFRNWFGIFKTELACKVKLTFSSENEPIVTILEFPQPRGDLAERHTLKRVMRVFSEVLPPEHDYVMSKKSLDLFATKDNFAPKASRRIGDEQFEIFAATGKRVKQKAFGMPDDAEDEPNWFKKGVLAPIEEVAHAVFATITFIKINYVDSQFFGRDAQIVPLKGQGMVHWFRMAITYAAGFIVFSAMALGSIALLTYLVGFSGISLDQFLHSRPLQAVMLGSAFFAFTGSYGVIVHLQSLSYDSRTGIYSHDLGQIKYSLLTGGRFFDTEDTTINHTSLEHRVSFVAPFRWTNIQLRRALRHKIDTADKALAVYMPSAPSRKSVNRHLRQPAKSVLPASRRTVAPHANDYKALFLNIKNKIQNGEIKKTSELYDFDLSKEQVHRLLDALRQEITNHWDQEITRAFGKNFIEESIRQYNSEHANQGLLTRANLKDSELGQEWMRILVYTRAFSLADDAALKEDALYYVWVLSRLDVPINFNLVDGHFDLSKNVYDNVINSPAGQNFNNYVRKALGRDKFAVAGFPNVPSQEKTLSQTSAEQRTSPVDTSAISSERMTRRVVSGDEAGSRENPGRVSIGESNDDARASEILNRDQQDGSGSDQPSQTSVNSTLPAADAEGPSAVKAGLSGLKQNSSAASVSGGEPSATGRRDKISSDKNKGTSPISERTSLDVSLSANNNLTTWQRLRSSWGRFADASFVRFALQMFLGTATVFAVVSLVNTGVEPNSLQQASNVGFPFFGIIRLSGLTSRPSRSNSEPANTFSKGISAEQKAVAFFVSFAVLLVYSLSSRQAENLGWISALGFYAAYESLLLLGVAIYTISHPVFNERGSSLISVRDRVLLFLHLQPINILTNRTDRNNYGDYLYSLGALPFAKNPVSTSNKTSYSESPLPQRTSSKSLLSDILVAADELQDQSSFRSATANGEKTDAAAGLPARMAVLLHVTTQPNSSPKETIASLSALPNGLLAKASPQYHSMVQSMRGISRLQSWSFGEAEPLNESSAVDFARIPTETELNRIHRSIVEMIELASDPDLLALLEQIDQEHKANVDAFSKKMATQHQIEVVLNKMAIVSPFSNKKTTSANGKTTTSETSTPKKMRPISQKQLALLTIESTVVAEAQRARTPSDVVAQLHREGLATTNQSALRNARVLSYASSFINSQAAQFANSPREGLTLSHQVVILAGQILTKSQGQSIPQPVAADNRSSHEARPNPNNEVNSILTGSHIFFLVVMGLGLAIPFFFDVRNSLTYAATFLGTIGGISLLAQQGINLLLTKISSPNYSKSDISSMYSSMVYSMKTSAKDPHVEYVAHTAALAVEKTNLAMANGQSLEDVLPAIQNMHVGERFLNELETLTIDDTKTAANFMVKKLLDVDLAGIAKITIDGARKLFLTLANQRSTKEDTKAAIGNRQMLAFDLETAKAHLEYLAPTKKIYVLVVNELERTALEALQDENPNKITLLDPHAFNTEKIIETLQDGSQAYHQTLNPEELSKLILWLIKNQGVQAGNLAILVPQGTLIQHDKLSKLLLHTYEGIIWMVGDFAVETMLLNKIEILAQALIQA